MVVVVDTAITNAYHENGNREGNTHVMMSCAHELRATGELCSLSYDPTRGYGVRLLASVCSKTIAEEKSSRETAVVDTPPLGTRAARDG